MKLTEEVKSEICTEYLEFKSRLYANKSLEERKELDQFFTPPSLTIYMIEQMSCESLETQKILDPTCGSGNLLIACLIAGAKLDNLYGNDYDATIVESCRNRLKSYAFAHDLYETPRKLNNLVNINIHRGNAMQKKCVTEFSIKYNKQYCFDYIDDLKYAQNTALSWEQENELAENRHGKSEPTFFEQPPISED